MMQSRLFAELMQGLPPGDQAQVLDSLNEQQRRVELEVREQQAVAFDRRVRADKRHLPTSTDLLSRTCPEHRSRARCLGSGLNTCRAVSAVGCASVATQ